MSQVTCQITMSLDGYVAGPNQRPEEPLGDGGEQLHEWMFATEAWQASHGRSGGDPGPDSGVVEEVRRGIGAYIMGRNMFTAGRGEWDLSWRGWWGDNPPYHVPVYVLTHYEREPLEMEGGTVFNFVTDGIESALSRAREAAGSGDVSIAGGASTVRQFLSAGLLDSLYLHVSPVLLGAGERLLDGVGDVSLEIEKTVASPRATHVKYRVLR
jgi:dihydrofolate reductase